MDVVVDHRQGDAHRQDGHSGERNCGIADEAVRLDLRVDVHPVRLIRLQRKTTRGMTGQTDPFIWWERSRMLGEKSAESEKRLSQIRRKTEKRLKGWWLKTVLFPLRAGRRRKLDAGTRIHACLQKAVYLSLHFSSGRRRRVFLCRTPLSHISVFFRISISDFRFSRTRQSRMRREGEQQQVFSPTAANEEKKERYVRQALKKRRRHHKYLRQFTSHLLLLLILIGKIIEGPK